MYLMPSWKIYDFCKFQIYNISFLKKKEIENLYYNLLFCVYFLGNWIEMNWR